LLHLVGLTRHFTRIFVSM